LPIQLVPDLCPYKRLLATALYELERLTDQAEDVRSRGFRAKVKLIRMAADMGVQLPQSAP